jgi:hypothetical protein
MNERTPLTVALSPDADKSWPWRRNVAEGPYDYAYPMAVQTADEKIHLIFTSHVADDCESRRARRAMDPKTVAEQNVVAEAQRSEHAACSPKFGQQELLMVRLRESGVHRQKHPAGRLSSRWPVTIESHWLNSKLASYLSASDRLRDAADVQALISKWELALDFLKPLEPCGAGGLRTHLARSGLELNAENDLPPIEWDRFPGRFRANADWEGAGQNLIFEPF